MRALVTGSLIVISALMWASGCTTTRKVGADGDAQAASTPSPSGPEPATPESSTINSSRAAALLTDPTAALIAEADAAYVLQDDEKALVALYWAFLQNADETGVFDVDYIRAGLPGAVLGLAKKYPTFFKTDGTGQVTASLVSGGDSSFACGQSCLPSAKSLGVAAKEAFGAVKAVRALSSLRTLFDSGKVVAASGKLVTEVTKAVWAGDQASVIQSLNAVAGAIIGVASTVGGALGVGAGVAAVGAIYAALSTVGTIASLLAAVDACVNYQSLSCCGTNGPCNTPPPTRCVDGYPMSLGVSTSTGTCNAGVCVYGLTLVACPSGNRCKAASPTAGSCSPCFSICGGTCVDTATALLHFTAKYAITPIMTPDTCWWSGNRELVVSDASVAPSVAGAGKTSYAAGALNAGKYSWSTAALEHSCPPDGAVTATRTEVINPPSVKLLDVDCMQNSATLLVPMQVGFTNTDQAGLKNSGSYPESIYVVVQTTSTPSGISFTGTADLGSAYASSNEVLTITGTLSATP